MINTQDDLRIKLRLLAKHLDSVCNEFQWREDVSPIIFADAQELLMEGFNLLVEASDI